MGLEQFILLKLLTIPKSAKYPGVVMVRMIYLYTNVYTSAMVYNSEQCNVFTAT